MVRFSPSVRIKTFSMSSLALQNIEAGVPAEEAVRSAIAAMQGSVANNYGTLETYLRNNFHLIFKDVGLAERVSISEDYGTREVFGVGNPEDPAIIQNNLTVQVSMSRLSLDTRALNAYITDPSFWYNPGLQRSNIEAVGNQSGVAGSAGADYPFYTFLAVSDIEHGGFLPSNSYDSVLNYKLYAFMPRRFSVDYTVNDIAVSTNVDGVAKIIRIGKLVEQLTGFRAGPSITLGG